MTTAPDAVYLAGLTHFGAVVESVPSGAWGRPTPCARWRAIDVLGHVSSATRFGIDLLRTGTPSFELLEEPGATVRGDPITWWRELEATARDALEGVDLERVVETPGAGRRTVGEGLCFPAIDLYVHAWDLGRAVGLHPAIPGSVIAFARGVLDALPGPELRSPLVFGDEVEPPKGATESEVFLAWTGRDPRWEPPEP